MNFLLSPQCKGSAGILTLELLPPVEFSIMWGGPKIIVSLQDGAYTRELRKKSLSPLCPVQFFSGITTAFGY